MDWTNKNVNPAKVVHTGQEVEVMVLDVDEERRRISLGLKQCKANPWKEFAENYNRGDKCRDRSSPSPTSASHRLPGNIDGLVHLSDISWDCRARGSAQLPEGSAAGSDGAVHRSGARAYLSRIKQLAKDPFSAYIAKTPRALSSRAPSRKWMRAEPSSTRQRDRRAVACSELVATVWRMHVRF